MKNLKKMLVLAIVVVLVGVVSTAYAAATQIPAEIVADLTGKTTSELYQERLDGKTYGEIANEAGQLEQFKAQVLEQKKSILEQRVSEGRLTQEQADSIYQDMQSRQAICGGTGNGQGGYCGAGLGRGQGFGGKNGIGDGTVNGQGMKNGYCRQ